MPIHPMIAEPHAIPPHKCDRCDQPGVDFFDGFWFCEACRKAYIERVSREAIS